ncbi:hypothetical protein ACP4OV_006383 [Aristida adscensionis]
MLPLMMAPPLPLVALHRPSPQTRLPRHRHRHYHGMKISLQAEHIRKGLQFIGSNASYIADEACDMPAGFNIIFPSMIRSGIDMGLELPLRQSDVARTLQLREMELQRVASKGKSYLGYVAEALWDMEDWDEILTYQHKNGSLFNSPSATAGLAIHSHNNNALRFLEFLENKLGSSAPTAYPENIYSQLHMVDTIEKLGISHHFSCEINSILDMTYRSWLHDEKELLMDIGAYPMSFRILRTHGYEMFSDEFCHLADEFKFQDSVQIHHNETKTLLEFYKASHIRIFEDESNLENIGLWSEPYQATEDILALAIEEFNSSQSLYQQELDCIKRWLKQVGLDQLKVARNAPMDIWVFMASTVFPSALSEARIAWIQNCLLVIAIDDFFEGGGSMEELENLTALIEKWEAHDEIGFCSKHVEILFCAIYYTSSEIGAKAADVQNRKVISHITELWLEYLRANMIEAEWTRQMYMPTMEEYMSVADVSIALGPITATTLYLVGPKISEDMIKDQEYKDLLRLTSTCCRLLNDHIQEGEWPRIC